MCKSHDLHKILFLLYTSLLLFIKQLKVMVGHVTGFLLRFLIRSSFLGVILGLKLGSLVIIDPTHAYTNFKNIKLRPFKKFKLKS